MQPSFRRLACIAALLAICLWPQATHAQCAVSNGAATCSGDISAGVNFTNRVVEINTQDLTATITPAAGVAGIAGVNLGGTDEDADGMLLLFAGDSFGIDAAGNGIVGLSLGGAGRNGDEDSRTAGNANGEGGRAGGSGGTVSLTFDSGFVSVFAEESVLLSAQSGGNNGGGGGEGVTGAGFGGGGDGGAGGNSGKAETTIGAGDFMLTGNASTAFVTSSSAGNGGDGGEGRSGAGNTEGGRGGTGGTAERASLVVQSANVTLNSTSGTAMVVGSGGGDGGNGGRAETDTAGSSRGGDGGNGGASLGAIASFAGGSFQHSGLDDLLVVQSRGGDGGDGAEGRTDVVADSRGGSGGSGGSGGPVDLALDAGSFIVGSDGGTAIFAQSRGGMGGNGGEARTDVADARSDGGNAGSGGNAGAVTITGMAPGVTIETNSRLRPQHGLRAESLAGSGGKGGTGNSAVFGDGFGGDGGRGGGGGDVFVELFGSITTSGPQSQGIFARSYGGEGGSGGAGNATAGTGRGGASLGGGPSGRSSVTFTGSLNTSGKEANAIVVQSVGGFSGDAGSSVGFLAFGASDESAGNGATVEVTLMEGSTASTTGDDAAAVFVHSVGGGGGRGSSDLGVAALGGSGSAGGNGGVVIADLAGSISTSGERARAAHAASRGGGGGDGGAAAGIAALGGSGGTGGNGANVVVSNDAILTTQGDQSDALFAASVGGGGGSAHSTVGVVSIGGSGGSGGTGGDIFAGSTNGIATNGSDADGIFMHSVGGGGGDGTSAVSVTGGFSFAVGGRGGDGGDGGRVIINDGFVTEFFSVTTEGDRARGLFAQSVGGGGGDGGNAISASGSPTFDISLGASGSGGHAGDGDEVSVAFGGDITTSGSNAAALQAQSTGGGGGSAGTTVSSANGAVALTLAVGGNGGGGGAGGIASVGTSGRLTTTGEASPGLIAHSTGGGGGHSGTTVAGSSIDGTALGVSIGGRAGGGGDGGAATVVGSGDIATSGSNSPGLYTHSVGGGGGYSGTSVAANAITGAEVSASIGGSGGSGGAGGTVTIDVERAITTKGDVSPGLTALSAGGGGGHSGVTVSGAVTAQTSVDTSVGGSGGGGGAGGAVTVTSSQAISTEGHSSPAITAHSSGGGGGASHFTGSLSGVTSGSLNASVGGRGGVAGDGGEVTVTAGGDLATMGHNAPGISAMSIGGGGGESGITVSGVVAGGTNIGVSVGGDGGASGDGGKVAVTSTSSITTEGDHAVGIRAKSIARSGGNAGTVVTGSGIAGGNVGVSVGGNGGSGGSSATAMVTSSGDIATTGAYASAIEAQSIAGGGGSAKGTLTAAGLSLGNVDATVGGNGGSGGTAGDVTVDSSGALQTTTHHAFGILAQSHGGAGGDGGFAAEGGFTAGEVSGQLGATIGGSGGAGGTAGAVTVTARNQIRTADFGATGILAQSIGGNGGNGGNVYTGNVNFSTDGSAQVDVDVGGSGGSGAAAGTVTVNNVADISTAGFLAEGILAQSIGGNGGNGGNTYSVIGRITASATANVEVNVGGGGGSGATAEAVTIDNSGSITTSRGGATALRAQSIGGGGGRGGSAANINLLLPSNTPSGTSVNANIGLQVGGDGGSGNDGGEASIVNSGEIATQGNSAKGIVAHSVGGGGGDGGPSSSYALSFTGACTLAGATGVYNCSSGVNPSQTTQIRATLTAVIGGDGAGGGDAGNADVMNQASITTQGDVSHAIVAQSHGGGGGNAAEGDLGLAGWTTNQTAEDIARLGELFTTLPSLTNISVAVGGSGGAAGDGGAVTIRNLATLNTSGAHAYGIHAQSVGGGGGNGGAGTSSLWSAATVGGRGSGGGDGGTIEIETGFISTQGEGGVGLFAQSVGGGGGSAGDVEEAFVAPWLDLNIGVGVGVQEDSGAGGNGGDITVASGPITTAGERAHGMVLQSVGGSGGVVGISGVLEGFNVNSFAGSAGDSGNSGAIMVETLAPILVSGQQAHGIIAQSTSGSGSSDTSGAISITLGADIRASGEAGRAILAQSASGDGQNNTISIAIPEGVTVMTAANGAETIGLFDGRDNTIVNGGTLMQAGGAEAGGFVVRTNGTAALTVTNNGLLEGSVRAELSPSGAAAAAAATSLQGITIDNNQGASFGLGSEVTLGGAAGRLNNAGTISAGGSGAIATSAVSGIVTQGTSGTTLVDFDFGGANDLITIDASGANSFAGSVSPNPLSGLPNSGDAASFAILRSAGALASQSLTVADSATVDYSLERITNTQGDAEVLLAYSVDFTPFDNPALQPPGGPAITDNQGSFGAYVDVLVSASNSGALTSPEAEAFVEDLVLSFLTTPDVASLADAYDSLAPGEIFAPSDASLFSSLRFSDSLMSCPKNSEDGAVTFTRQGSCLWFRASGGGIDRQRTSSSIDYDETYYGVALGGQTALGDGFFLGGAFAYEDSNLSNDGFSGDGNRFQGGVVAKQEIGATTLSTSLTGGVGRYDLSRSVITPGGPVTADSSPNTNWVAFHARAAHTIDLTERLYLEPSFDVGVDHQWQGSFAESGAGGFGLEVDGFNQTLVTLNPVLEVGNSFEVFGVQANATAGAGLLAVVSGRDRSTDVRFLGLGGSGPSFQVSDQARPVFADLEAGLELVVHDRAVVSLGGTALLSGNQQEYGGAGRISIFF